MPLDPVTAYMEPDERLEIMAHAKAIAEKLDAEAEAAAGVTFNQALVLTFIECEKGKATVSSLAEPLNRAVHTLTSSVNALERTGLVERTVRPGGDRRVFLLQATSAGSQAVRKLRQTTLPLPVTR